MSNKKDPTKCLQSAIAENIDPTTAANVEALAYETSIYVLYLADITEVSQKSLDAKFASFKVRYPARTYEQFMKQLKNWNEDKYHFLAEPQGYFIDEDTAVDYAVRNMGDINESGAYPYVLISSMPLNRVYPAANTRKFRIFLFNKKKEVYEEIDWDYSEATKILLRKGEGGFF